MPNRLQHPDRYELVDRAHSDDDEEEPFDLDEADFQSSGRSARSYATHRRGLSAGGLFSRLNPTRLFSRSSASYQPVRTNRRRKRPHALQRQPCRCPRPSRRCLFLFNGLLMVLGAFIILNAVFRPSYSRPPAHYQALRALAESSEEDGRANPENQKVYVAASLYDKGGHLLSGVWGQAVLKLVDLLGNENVYLSVYESESDEPARVAYKDFEKKIQCPHQVVYDRKFSVNDIPAITLPDGSERIKRIAYLAEMRNKALEPLQGNATTKYDKLLYLNDVIFDPIDAVQLLFSTNLDEDGRTSYRAACAVDFINPFKFYDTFASRDFEGFSMGVPFFPWFTTAGKGVSRQDVLAQKDAVRVKSCWGGMVAFDAKPFQTPDPVQFRATEEVFWDASECCLVHADLIAPGMMDHQDSFGIYMNPYVRVAYDKGTLGWLGFTRRFERLYSTVHNIINHLVGMPWSNVRRQEQPGQIVENKIWTSSGKGEKGGSFQTQSRTSAGDGYCGIRMLQVMKKKPKKGDKNWEIIPVPPL